VIFLRPSGKIQV